MLATWVVVVWHLFKTSLHDQIHNLAHDYMPTTLLWIQLKSNGHPSIGHLLVCALSAHNLGILSFITLSYLINVMFKMCKQSNCLASNSFLQAMIGYLIRIIYNHKGEIIVYPMYLKMVVDNSTFMMTILGLAQFFWGF